MTTRSSINRQLTIVYCSEERPCTYCVSNKIKYALGSTIHNRRTADLERELEDLEEDHDLLRWLMRTLCHKNAYVDELVDFICDKQPSLGQIKAYMDGTINADGVDKTPELLGVYEEVIRLNRLPARDTHWALDINCLCDIPIYSVPASSWTTIHKVDEFVSHLISLWFTWHYSRFNWIDRDLFLRDMKSGNLDSPLLFSLPRECNACKGLCECSKLFYSDYSETCATRGDSPTKGDHFYNEARRLLEAEEEWITLTIVQGLGVMYSLLACLAWVKPPQLDRQIGVRLPVHFDENDTWVPYPRQDESVPLHTNCVVSERANLSMIAHDVANFFFTDNERAPRADIENMYYDTMIMTIYAYLKTPPPDPDEATAKTASSARQNCIDSAKEVSNLVAIHGDRWGNARRLLHCPLTERCMTLKGMFRMVQISTLPADCLDVFREFEK
ncbi:hypothetical protein BJX64DRAFT_274497 [Aspergillus heterothallicus]